MPSNRALPFLLLAAACTSRPITAPTPPAASRPLVRSRRPPAWPGVRIQLYALAGERSAPPVVVVNGGPGASHESVARLARLASAGTRIVAYDQRGLGKSSAPGDDARYSLDDQVADLDAVRTALGVKTIALVGTRSALSSPWRTLLRTRTGSLRSSSSRRWRPTGTTFKRPPRSSMRGRRCSAQRASSASRLHPAVTTAARPRARCSRSSSPIPISRARTTGPSRVTRNVVSTSRPRRSRPYRASMSGAVSERFMAPRSSSSARRTRSGTVPRAPPLARSARSPRWSRSPSAGTFRGSKARARSTPRSFRLLRAHQSTPAA